MANSISRKIIQTIKAGDIHIMEWHHLFPVFTGRRRKPITLGRAAWHILEHDTNFEGVEFAKGSMFKFWESNNFTWVCFHPASKTPEGNQPYKYLFKSQS